MIKTLFIAVQTGEEVFCFCTLSSWSSISWRSKAQKSVALSSSEAKWVAASEAGKEVMLVLQPLQSVKIKGRLPIIVCVVNVEAIFMTKNNTTTG